MPPVAPVDTPEADSPAVAPLAEAQQVVLQPAATARHRRGRRDSIGERSGNSTRHLAAAPLSLPGRARDRGRSDRPPPAEVTVVPTVVPVAAAPRTVIEVAVVIVIVSMPAATVVTIVMLRDRGRGDERDGKPESDVPHPTNVRARLADSRRIASPSWHNFRGSTGAAFHRGRELSNSASLVSEK
jgi:hypothetical protein